MDPTRHLQDPKIHVRLKLSALWAAIVSCYIYGDFWGLYRPGTLKGILEGEGPLGPISQGSLVAVSVLVAIPAAMIFLSLALPAELARWLNILIGAALTAIVLATLTEGFAEYNLGDSEVLTMFLVVVACGYQSIALMESPQSR